MTAPTVLLVDDEPGVLFTLREVLHERGLGVVTAASGAAALPLLDDVAVVVTDLQMPGMTGLELCAAVTARDPTIPVILLTAYGSDKVAVAAVAAGAYDYLTKPFDIDHVAVVIDRALEAHALRLANRRAAIEAAVGRRIIAESRPMRRLLDATARVATRDVTVLVRGETGTGKEFIAQLLHAQSRRAARPLVRFNCAALPADLAEAELFGHVRGAFTGAVANRRGFFAEADGGTLVLDEVGELPLPIQAKLLRALQEGEIQPVGSGRIERVDVRVVAATHRDLTAAARAGTFREDLYYRLAVVRCEVPPLRARPTDLPRLARHFAESFGRSAWELSPTLLAELARHDWPGNVRELRNVIERALSLGMLAVDREPRGPEPVAAPIAAAAAPAHAGILELPFKEAKAALVEGFERDYLVHLLARHRGNISRAAHEAGIDRNYIHRLVKKYGLDVERG